MCKTGQENFLRAVMRGARCERRTSNSAEFGPNYGGIMAEFALIRPEFGVISAQCAGTALGFLPSGVGWWLIPAPVSSFVVSGAVDSQTAGFR
jgi:hypothetical protein